MRRWRGLKLKRGVFYGGTLKSPVPPAYPPPLIRQAGPLRLGARLLPSRRRWNDPGWGQASQGQAWPSFIKQAGSKPRFGAKLAVSHGRRFDPPWFPPPPVPPPQWLHQAGPLRTPARLLPSRRRRFDPGWGQGNQGQSWPSWIEPAGSRPRFGARPVTSRNRRFEPPWIQPPPIAPPQMIRPAGPLRFGARPVTSRGRFANPGWGQANQGQPWPSYMRQAPVKIPARLVTSHGRRMDPPLPQSSSPPGSPTPGLLLVVFP